VHDDVVVGVADALAEQLGGREACVARVTPGFKARATNSRRLHTSLGC